MQTHDIFRLIWPERKFSGCEGAWTFEDGQPPPTEQEVEEVRAAAQQLFDAERQATVEGEALRLRLLVIFGAQPLGVQRYFKGLADDLRELLQAGQIEEARELIETAPIADSMEQLRAALLAEFPQD